MLDADPTHAPLPLARDAVIDRYFLEHRAKVLDRAGRVIEEVHGKADGRGMTWFKLPPDTYKLRIACLPAPEPEPRP